MAGRRDVVGPALAEVRHVHANDRVQLSVEAPQERVRLIRVAGALDRAAASSLLRLVDAQLALIAAHRCRVTDLIVDLDEVSSFEPGGLEVVRSARHSAGTRGIGLHLTGCSARFQLLPLRASQLLAAFSTFPTIEAGLTALAYTCAPIEPPTNNTTAAASTGQIHDGPGDLIATSSPGPPPGPPLPTAELPAPRRPADPSSESGSEPAAHRRSSATTLPPR